MSTLRVNYAKLAPQAYQGLVAVNTALVKGGLGARLLGLINLRVSQINGCAYCVDKHARELFDAGEDAQRINSLTTWHEVEFFDTRERAALAWAESVTRVAETRAPDEAFQALVDAGFSEKEIAELTFAVATMNAWNRIAIAVRQPVARAPELVREAAHA